MPRCQEITATFISERNVFDNDDGTRVIIGSVETPDDEITIKGEAAKGTLYRGVTYRFFGTWRNHQRFGRQFWFNSFVAERPVSREGTIAYIQRCKGIGPAKAKQIWEAFGAETLDKMKAAPGEVAEAVPRLTRDDAFDAAEWLAVNEAQERVTVEMIGLLDGRGFPAKTTARAIREWGVEAPEKIRENPFILMQFSGCGFLTCDKFYLDLRHDPAWIGRQALCAWHAVIKNSDGSTWFPEAQIRSAIRASIAGAKADPDRALKHAIEEDGLLAIIEHDGQRYIAERGKANKEAAVADGVLEALDKCSSEWPDIQDIEGISEHQRGQLIKALSSPIGILRGSPGTGKTHSSAALIRAIIKAHGSDSIAVAAPTGKAAVRLTEALNEAGVDDAKVSTIHRLLQVASEKGGGFTFLHNGTNPLPFRFLIIDESSMIDTNLMFSLLVARAVGTHILFVGDPYQLPPVGHGRPFLDMMAKVPAGELTEIQRNSGQIVKACAEIRDTKRFSQSQERNINAGENLKWWKCPDADTQISSLAQALEEVTNGMPDFQEGRPLNPIWDCQVLVAVNAKSEVSRKELNQRLQRILNARGAKFENHPFRIGDKVVCLKNQQLETIDPGEEEKVYVANGELGEVVSIEPGKTIVRLSNPDRIVIVPRPATTAANGDGSHIKSSANGQRIRTNPRDESEDEDKQVGAMGDWDLGYALSCHKSQGSDWPVVIIAVDESGAAKRVMNRNWIYTAISRAKHYCLLLGKPETAMAACKKDGISHRKTLLAERIRGEEFAYPAIDVPEPVTLSAGEIDELFSAAL